MKMWVQVNTHAVQAGVAGVVFAIFI